MTTPKKALPTLLLLLLLVFPGFTLAQQQRRTSRYVPGEVLVKFRSGVSAGVARATHRVLGSRRIRRFKRINVDHVRIPRNWTVEDAVSIYGQDRDVEYVEPNYIRWATVIPNDPVFNDPDDPGFGSLWGLEKIACPEAWDIETGSRNVVVAVLDTGIDLDHEDLKANIWTNSGESIGDHNDDGFPGIVGVDDDGDGLIDEDSAGREPDDLEYTNDLKDDDDENGYADDINGWDFVDPEDNSPDDDFAGVYHGTHVSGTVAARGNNGIGITGVNWVASIMPLKVIDSTGTGEVADEIMAIEYAYHNGADVISASFGGPDPSQPERDAITKARDHGLLFVTAAGNNGIDNDSSPERKYPASYDLDNIIAVAASGDDDSLMWWSNYGAASVDVVAPGAGIYSTINDDGYAYMSGTSMATPHVAGLAALIMSHGANLTYVQVKERILNGVNAKAGLKGKILSGGRINAYNSLMDIPGAPGNLVATAVSDSRIDLTWTDGSYGESGFLVERKTGSGDYGEIAALGEDVESYSDTGLIQGTTYQYRVRAHMTGRNSGYSNEVAAAPIEVSASAASSSSNSGGSGGGGGGGGGGCFIATAAYGSAYHTDLVLFSIFMVLACLARLVLRLL